VVKKTRSFVGSDRTCYVLCRFCTCAGSYTSAQGLHIDYFSISKSIQLLEDREVY
jgi:hypothetical protein